MNNCESFIILYQICISFIKFVSTDTKWSEDDYENYDIFSFTQ